MDSELESAFWPIIDRAARSRSRLAALLGSLDRQQLHDFQRTFLQLSADLQSPPFTQYVSSDESEDGLTDITNWVVSQGSAVYHDVERHPERIPNHVDVDDPSNLFAVAYDVYFDRFDEELDISF